MSFKEVTNLRKSGQLEEAYALAEKELKADAGNLYNKRSMAWVCYDYLKKKAVEEDFEGVIAYLEILKELDMPTDEKMVFDQSAFQILKVVSAIFRTQPVNYKLIDRIFDLIKNFSFTRPSEAWSAIFKAFHKGNREWSRYIEFADWWNFDYFLPRDYEPETYNGKRIMAVVEQAHVAYARRLLELLKSIATEQDKRSEEERTNRFLLQLDRVIEKHPEYRYPVYSKARLLLATGADMKEALATYLPFARKKQTDFWVWQMLAEMFENEPGKRFACYCKALSLKAPEEYLVKARQRFVALLLDKELHGEAKREIEQIVKVRQEQQWKTPPVVSRWQQESWYKNATPSENKDAFYRKHAIQAEQLLFEDLPEETIVVVNVNHEKKMLNYQIDRERSGFFKYGHLVKEPQPLDLLKVRFRERKEDGFSLVTTARKTNDATSPLIKPFTGTLKIIKGDIGFVGDVFISPDLINRFKLEHGAEVSGRALQSFNKKRNEWGWRAIRIDSLTIS